MIGTLIIVIPAVVIARSSSQTPFLNRALAYICCMSRPLSGFQKGLARLAFDSHTGKPVFPFDIVYFAIFGEPGPHGYFPVEDDPASDLDPPTP